VAASVKQSTAARAGHCVLSMQEQALAEEEPRPRRRLRGPLAPVRVVLGAGRGVGHALQGLARRGRGALASVTAGQLYGDTEEAAADECASAPFRGPCHTVLRPANLAPVRKCCTCAAVCRVPCCLTPRAVWRANSELCTHAVSLPLQPTACDLFTARPTRLRIQCIVGEGSSGRAPAWRVHVWRAARQRWRCEPA